MGQEPTRDIATTAEEVAQAPQTIWRETHSVICETVVGHAVGAALHRFVLGEISYNPTPNAKLPNIRPSVTLVIPHVALPSIIASLQVALDGMETEAAADAE